MDSNTCKILKNNVEQYSLDNVDIKCGDYLKLAASLKQDVIFLDPPWGGKNYKQVSSMDLYMSGENLYSIVKKISVMAKMIVIKIPNNYNITGFYQQSSYHKITVYRMNKFSLIALMTKDFNNK